MSKNKALSDFVSDISNAAVGDYLFLDSDGDRTIARQVLGSDISGFVAPYDSAGITSLLDSNYVDTQMGGGGATSITGADVNSKLAALDNSVVPTTSMNLGSNTKKWRNIYTNKLSFGGISIDTNGLDGGNATLSGFTTPSDYVLVNNIVLSTPAAPTDQVLNSSYTSFLLKTDSTQTDTQVDASSNSLTITNNGDLTSSPSSPYHPKGYSVYFDGSGDYLRDDTIGDGMDSSIDNYSDNYTIELWVYTENPATNTSILGSNELSSGLNSFVLLSKELIYANAVEFTYLLTANTWHHMAIQFERGDTPYLSMWLDGTRLGRSAVTGAFSWFNNVFAFGTEADAGNFGGLGNYFKGYMHDVKISKEALYGDVATISIPTEPTSPESSNVFSGFTNPYIDDNFTVGGNTTTKLISPYDHVAYSPSDHGGSIYMDGTGTDYLSFANPALGTGDFTVECWIKPESTDQRAIWDPRNGATTNNTLWIYSSGGVVGYYASGAWRIVGTTVLKLNQWHHVAVSRVSGTTTLYLNGKSEGTFNDTYSYTSSTTFIGRWYNGTTYGFEGNIADFRLVAGTGIYTAEFTPPTEPLSDVTNTDVLTCINKNSIYDASGGNSLTVFGDTTTDTNTTKYSSSSIYFDGSGDYLKGSASSIYDMGAGDFTVEFWTKTSNISSSPCLVAVTSGGGPSNTQWGIFAKYASTTSIDVYLSNGTSYFANTGGGNISDGEWHHVAFSRDGASGRLFLDGVQVGSTLSVSTTQLGPTGKPICVGSQNGSYNFNGYIEDVRVTKGLARYTSNFTPPTAALEG